MKLCSIDEESIASDVYVCDELDEFCDELCDAEESGELLENPPELLVGCIGVDVVLVDVIG